MGEPLELAGALHDTSIVVPFAEPVGFPGASGGAAGVNAADAAEYELVPCALTAATLNK